jgi:hypothetical protein
MRSDVSNMTNDDPEQKPVAISLVPRQWVVVLACLNEFIHTKVGPRIDKLREQGADPKAVSSAERTVLAGSVIAQGLIIKELAAHGVMTEEANDKLGIDALMRRLSQEGR